MNKKGNFFMVILFFTLIIFGVLYVNINGINYETTINGKHTGTITAVEETGLIFKTITIYFKSDAQSSQEDTYCLIDRTLLKKIEDYSKNKTKVTIIYNDYLIRGMKHCSSENGGIIIGFE